MPNGINILPGSSTGFTGLQGIGEGGVSGIGGVSGLPGVGGISSGLATLLAGGSATEAGGSGLGAAIGGAFGGPIGAIGGSYVGGKLGKVLGGKKIHASSTGGLSIPGNLSEFGIQSDPFTATSYRHRWNRMSVRINSLNSTYDKIKEMFIEAGFELPQELRDFFKLPHSIGAQRGGVDTLNQDSVNLFSASVEILNTLESEKGRSDKFFTDQYLKTPNIKFFSDAVSGLKSTDITSTPPEKPGIDKDVLKKAAFSAARHFSLRLPRLKLDFPKQAFGSSSFVPRPRTTVPPTGSFDISDLEKQADLIFLSGFTSKQSTTQSRALALDAIT